VAGLCLDQPGELEHSSRTLFVIGGRKGKKGGKEGGEGRGEEKGRVAPLVIL